MTISYQPLLFNVRLRRAHEGEWPCGQAHGNVIHNKGWEWEDCVRGIYYPKYKAIYIRFDPDIDEDDQWNAAGKAQDEWERIKQIPKGCRLVDVNTANRTILEHTLSL